MNVQTEKLENHLARLTVEIDAAQLDKAKKKAAKNLARRVNIPGFRKGKVPYRVLINYVGEAPIIEEAIEALGNDVYRDALEESGIKPYASGELEDFKIDPQPTFVFTVPMQPTVELNDYLSVRADYEEVSVEESEVDDQLRMLQEDKAVFEVSEAAAAAGNRVTIDLHGFFEDEETEESEDDDEAEEVEDADDAVTDEAEVEDSEDDEEDDHARFEDAVIHDHDAEIFLDETRDPVPGFINNLIGATTDEEREFIVDYPEDEEKFGTLAGRKVRFVVHVKKIETATLPELNDELAALATEDDPEPLSTLDELKDRIRQNIQDDKTENYESEYYQQVLDLLVEKADFAYPEAMINNQIDNMVESTAQQFGVGVEDYLRLTQQSFEALHQDEQYREAAIRYIKRSLVMRGILDKEELTVSDAEIQAEIDRFLVQFAEQAEMYRSMFNTPEMRDSVESTLLERKVQKRIVGIGRGEEHEAVAAASDDSDEVDGSEAVVDEVESDDQAESSNDTSED